MASVAASAGRKLRQRGVTLKIVPEPVTFNERRSVLKLLEQYGEVSQFTTSPFKKGTCVSLMKDAGAAQTLIAASPLRFTMQTPSITHAPSFFPGLLAPDRMSKAAPRIDHEGSPGNQQPLFRGGEIKSTKEFVVWAWETQHAPGKSTCPLQASWPHWIDDKNSFIAKTLKQTVPHRLSYQGLANWHPDMGQKDTGLGHRHLQRYDRLGTNRWIPSKMKQEAATTKGEKFS